MARHFAGPYRHPGAKMYHTDDDCPVATCYRPQSVYLRSVLTLRKLTPCQRTMTYPNAHHARLKRSPAG
jgi:hypothetical protein